MRKELYMQNYAPIVLFVYNRPAHTKRLYDSLMANKEAKDSVLYIVADGYKEKDDPKVTEVRKLIHEFCGFKEIVIIERESNWGIEKSEQEAITDIVNKHGKIISLEDDIVVNRHFLRYMNEALNKFEGSDRVYSVTGYTYGKLNENYPESFFTALPSSWGWGTWADKWNKLKMPVDIVDFRSIYRDRKLQKRLDCFGAYPWFQMLAVRYKNTNELTWDLCWHLAIQKNNGIILTPRIPLCINAGFDGSGVHHKAEKSEPDRVDDDFCVSEYPTEEEINSRAFKTIRKQMRKKRGFVKLMKERYFLLFKKFRYYI